MGRGIKGEGLLNNPLLRERGQEDRLLNNLMRKVGYHSSRETFINSPVSVKP